MTTFQTIEASTFLPVLLLLVGCQTFAKFHLLNRRGPIHLVFIRPHTAWSRYRSHPSFLILKAVRLGTHCQQSLNKSAVIGIRHRSNHSALHFCVKSATKISDLYHIRNLGELTFQALSQIWVRILQMILYPASSPETDSKRALLHSDQCKHY